MRDKPVSMWIGLAIIGVVAYTAIWIFVLTMSI